MSDWKMKTESDFGRVRVTLLQDGAVVAVISIPQNDYREIARKLFAAVIVSGRESIAPVLGERLWQDAQSIFGLSPDLAKQKLLEFGWSQQKIDAYADELARAVARHLAELLPGSG